MYDKAIRLNPNNSAYSNNKGILWQLKRICPYIIITILICSSYVQQSNIN